jgi:amino acid adenylation domain-containing protein
MLTDSQREAVTLLLRRGQADDTGKIPRRRTALAEPPLSHGQEQLWFINGFAPGLPTYNIQQVLRLSGALDHLALERALDRLVERHEALRTCLVADGQGRPVQVIAAPGKQGLDREDLAGEEPGVRLVRLREFVRAVAMRPFDLAVGPLLRTCLVRLGEAEHVLVAVVHHAVFDGWSAGVLVRDLAALYRGEVSEEPSGLGELAVQFADYAVWERERLAGEFLADLESYWRGVLDGLETVRFPADRPRPVIDCFDGALAERMTDAALLAGLREVSRQEGVTLFVTLLAGLLTLLHRYTGQNDLVVGTVSANRGRAELAPLIGFLVNTLPIRCDLSGDPAFRNVLARVKEATVGAFAHQDLPFGKLVDTLKVERDASRAAVFQIALTYAEHDDTPVTAAGVEFAISDLVRSVEAAKFDLTFAAEARRDGLWIECAYKTSLFDAATVQRLLVHLETLLHGVVAAPSARLSQLPLLTEAELKAELHDWNDTAAPVPPICVHEGFEAQAARTPDAIAAEYEGERISYAELNGRANQIARRLRGAGVGPEALVGVCMTTSLGRLAALLGIWKAGGGYVPLDPALPAERLAFMIADAGMRVIVADASSAGSIPGADLTVFSLDGLTGFSLDEEWEQSTRLPVENQPETGVTSANVAYVIYTSGSTGQPKGVVVEHRHAVNALDGMIGQWGIGPADAVLQFASFAFDVSVMDMFMTLLAGARVVLAPSETLHSPSRLAALIRQTGITFASLPPAVLNLLPAGPYPDLRILMVGGEALPSELARRWIRPGLRLVNAYGPTEATVNATYAELDAATRMPPPIGFPARQNYRAYVLDAYLNPVPPGVTGELHIGGASVARGYLNRPELTRERFIPDPFLPGQRLYKSGDLVRRRPGGSLDFVGRIDNQVKIRGLRIELGEIEAVLAAHPAIAQAIAIARAIATATVSGQPGDQQLVAYLRPAPGSTVSEQDVRAHLARALPAWMIPAHLVTVEAFPLNSSGKVDRSALPEPAPHGPAADHVVPSTLLEVMLADIYSSLLGADRVGATDSFFDLGGNSLQAMRLIGVLDSELDVDIGAAAVFVAPTPRQLAALLRDKHGFSDAEPGTGGFEPDRTQLDRT